MVQMTRVALQALIDRDIKENTAGEITATILNEVLTDITDSVDILATGALAPSIRSFNIDGQALFVDPGTTLSGLKTFNYSLTEEDNVSGTLTLAQGVSNLSTTVDPKNSSVDLTINSVTLNAGDTVTWTLSGTDTLGPNNFSRTFTVTAYEDSDYVYYSIEADDDPSDVVIGSASRIPFAGTQQSFTTPTFSGNQYLTILQRASEPDITQIFIDGLNQFDAFTKTLNALTINSQSYDAYVSTNALVGSVVSGEQVIIVRG